MFFDRTFNNKMLRTLKKNYDGIFSTKLMIARGVYKAYDNEYAALVLENIHISAKSTDSFLQTKNTHITASASKEVIALLKYIMKTQDTLQRKRYTTLIQKKYHKIYPSSVIRNSEKVVIQSETCRPLKFSSFMINGYSRYPATANQRNVRIHLFKIRL